MKYLYYRFPASIILLLFLTILFLYFRKKRIIKKIRSMTMEEKTKLINHIIEPVGFIYEPYKDIFATRLRAPQKLFGYTTFYDWSAPFFHMVFDYETIYFDYNERTWLIEMWKGQYGINSGCELGIYYADSLVSPEDYKTTLFYTVDEKDMLDISLKLNRRTKIKSTSPTKIGYLKYHHWWLTIFKMGLFSKPKQLFVNACIRFKNYPMLHSFLDSFDKTMPPDTQYRLNGLNLYFTFGESRRKYPWYQKLLRSIALKFCHLYCIVFNVLTKTFKNTGDKILYLYFYLPFALRFIFKIKKKNKRFKKASLKI